MRVLDKTSGGILPIELKYLQPLLIKAGIDFNSHYHDGIVILDYTEFERFYKEFEKNPPPVIVNDEWKKYFDENYL